jgi:hypothetical protein
MNGLNPRQDLSTRLPAAVSLEGSAHQLPGCRSSLIQPMLKANHPASLARDVRPYKVVSRRRLPRGFLVGAADLLISCLVADLAFPIARPHGCGRSGSPRPSGWHARATVGPLTFVVDGLDLLGQPIGTSATLAQSPFLPAMPRLASQRREYLSCVFCQIPAHWDTRPPTLLTHCPTYPIFACKMAGRAQC